jgi:hypothetical protein
MQDSERLDAPTGLRSLHTSLPTDAQDVQTSTHASTLGGDPPGTDSHDESPVSNAVIPHRIVHSDPSTVENTPMYAGNTQPPSNVETHFSDKHFVNTTTHSESDSPAEVACDFKQRPWHPSLIRFGPLTGIIGKYGRSEAFPGTYANCWQPCW